MFAQNALICITNWVQNSAFVIRQMGRDETRENRPKVLFQKAGKINLSLDLPLTS
jgi:hypothetical protein